MCKRMIGEISGRYFDCFADFAWNYYGIWDEDRARPIGNFDKAMAKELNIPL
ncbi:hypothetical protein ACQKNS_26735 [Peribacillus sp. NPDC094092]|uniref:hypothetical protein n=1 Tax=Peribacillus sp. NPDC094092 TaxID=3390611 RepID=UPI003CFC43EA